MINSNIKYHFAKSFISNLYKNTKIEADEDVLAYIKMTCESTEPYRKIDNKGRHSEYFTMRVCDILITVVCEEFSKKIITAVIETHIRPQFKGL